MSDYRQALPVGFVLASDYRITGVLGQGGFGLTYKADDLRLGRPVAVKEYFPTDLALRERRSTVVARSSREEGVLAWGRAKFLEEARTLARFRHRSIVRVSRLFEANNTAYMVLDFEMGPNLAEWRNRLHRPPTQKELDRIAGDLIEAVEAVHAAGILHRDIKPANVIMRDGDAPVLIDFGAARQALSAQSKTVHAIVTPGYSPKEQYAVDLDRQGAWSDIYALGATLYFLVTGKSPPDALSRDLGEDMAMPASDSGPWRKGFLDAISAAMTVEASARPQSVAEWRRMLLGTGGRTGATVATLAAPGGNGRKDTPAPGASPSLSVKPSPRPELSFDDLPATPPPPIRRPKAARPIVVLALISGIAALGGLAYWIGVEAPSRDAAAWQAALATNTAAAFERYTRDQPSGRHVDEARRRLQALRVAEAGVPGTVAPPAATPVAGAAPSPEPPVTALSGQPTPGAGAPASRADNQTTEPRPLSEVAAVATERECEDGTRSVFGVCPTRIPPQPLPAASTARPPLAPASTQARPSEPPRATVPPAVSTAAETFERSGPPLALSDKDITELAVAAPRARWKAVNAAALGDTSAGFGEQAQDFAAELLRTSAGKLEIELTETATVAQAIATPARIAADRQTFAWHTPTHAAGDRPERAILAGSVPFGLGPVEHVRWLRAEGTRLLEQSYADAGTPVRAIPCGIAGGVGGWFRREIRSPSDLKGLKIAAPELMSRALATLEATSVRVNARSEIASAFSANRIDASLWYTPETDTFLGRARPATAYHFPGVHSPALVFDLLIGRPAWEAMPVAQRRLLDEACRRNLDRWAQAFPTTQNDVLDRIRAQRILVRPLTGPLRETLRKATDQIMDEESARNQIFRTVRESYEKFRRQ